MFRREYENIVTEKIALLNRERHAELCALEALAALGGSFCRTFIYKGVKDVSELLMRAVVSNPSHTNRQFVESILHAIFKDAERGSASEESSDLDPFPFPTFLSEPVEPLPERSMRLLERRYGREDIASAEVIADRTRILKAMLFDGYRNFVKVVVSNQKARPFVLRGSTMMHYRKPLEVMATRYKTVLTNTGAFESFEEDARAQESRNLLSAVVLGRIMHSYTETDSVDLGAPSSGLDDLRWLNVFVNYTRRAVDYVGGERAYHELGNDKSLYLIVSSEEGLKEQYDIPKATLLPHDADELLIASSTHLEYALRKIGSTVLVYYSEAGREAELFESGFIRTLLSSYIEASVQIREYFGYLDKDYRYVNGKAVLESEEFLALWDQKSNLTESVRALLRGRRYRAVGKLTRTVLLCHIRVPSEEGDTHNLYLHLPGMPRAGTGSGTESLIETLHRGEAPALSDLQGGIFKNGGAIKGSLTRAFMEHPTPEDLFGRTWGSFVRELRASEGKCVFRMSLPPYELEFVVEASDRTVVRVFDNGMELENLRRSAESSVGLNSLFEATGPDVARAYREVSSVSLPEGLPKAFRVSDERSSLTEGPISDLAMREYARWCTKSPDSDWTHLSDLFDLERTSLSEVVLCVQNLYKKNTIRALASRDFESDSSAFNRDDVVVRRRTSGYTATVFAVDKIKSVAGALEYVMSVYRERLIVDSI